MSNEAIQGYKGFDKNLKCRDYLFTVGCTFEQKGKIKACNNGFHFCENPLDVFYYYPPANSRYCAVEGNGELDKHDNKTACSVLKVKAEIGLPGLIKAGVEYIKSRVDWDSAKATNTGYRSAATNTGNASAASVEGQESVAAALGIEGRAKGAKGCWIVLAEWTCDKEKHKWRRVDVQCFFVDDEKVKADTYYVLRGGVLTEWEA